MRHTNRRAVLVLLGTCALVGPRPAIAADGLAVPSGAAFKVRPADPLQSVLEGVLGAGKLLSVGAAPAQKISGSLAGQRYLWRSERNGRLMQVRAVREVIQKNGSRVVTLKLGSVDPQNPLKEPVGFANGGGFYLSPKGRVAYRVKDDSNTWPALYRQAEMRGSWHPTANRWARTKPFPNPRARRTAPAESQGLRRR